MRIASAAENHLQAPAVTPTTTEQPTMSWKRQVEVKGGKSRPQGHGRGWLRSREERAVYNDMEEAV